MHKSRTNTNCQRQSSQPPVPVWKSMQTWGGGCTCLSEFITPVLSETLPLNLKKAAPGCVVSGIRVFVWPFCAFVQRWPFVSISGPEDDVGIPCLFLRNKSFAVQQLQQNPMTGHFVAQKLFQELGHVSANSSRTLSSSLVAHNTHTHTFGFRHTINFHHTF